MGRSSNNRFAIVIGISVIIITLITVYITCLGSNNTNNFSVFAQGNSQANPMNASSGSTLNAAVNSLNFTSAAGTIASLQNEVNGKQSWVVSGTWHLLVFKPRFEENKMSPATVTFDSIFDMVRLNGQAKHEHTMSVSDFNLTKVNNFVNSTDQVLTTTFNGTSKITMEGSSQNNVSTSIKIMDKGTISLWVDPSKINYHFGNTPIYGIISKQSG
ncbi:MAG TPA: hypothetical protein VFJ51_12210 [Nitrososphaeraceae archaeon]|nr:hypothetical protein [Nitrososphaeraceae archaeon]